MNMSEEARRLGISRQRLWQIEKAKKGLCVICGKPALKASPVISLYLGKKLVHCKKHQMQGAKYRARYYKKNRVKILKTNAIWQAKNKEKFAEYQKKYSEKKRKEKCRS